MYTLNACEELIQRYLDYGGEFTQLEEGCLGLGLVMLTAHGKKTAIITEVFINEGSSGHKIRMYNKTPKKYLNYENQELDT